MFIKNDVRFVLPPVACRRAHFLSTLFVFACVLWYPTHIELFFYLFFFVFLIGFWNCYENMAFFVIHFIYLDILVNIRCKNQECTCMVCLNKNNGNIMSYFSNFCQQITTKRQRKCIDFLYISKCIVLIYTATMIK